MGCQVQIGRFLKNQEISDDTHYSERPKKVVIARNVVTKQSHEIASLCSQ
jgi:hypothetical protein